MKDCKEIEKEFYKIFAKLGFKIVKNTDDQVIAHVMGKDYGVFMDISLISNIFSIELVCDIFSQKVFYWQHFDSYEEIYNLIVKNSILSEQILEKLDLAIYT